VAFKLKIKMNVNSKQQHPDKSVNGSVSSLDESFNFELWARAVKPQLLAIVKKNDECKIIPQNFL